MDSSYLLHEENFFWGEPLGKKLEKQTYYTYQSLLKSYIERIPRKSGLYALYTTEKRPLLHGESDIIYIGKSKNLRKRVGSYFSTQTPVSRDETTARIRRVIQDKFVRILYKRVIKSSLEDEEIRLLEKFEEEHYQLPSLNRTKSSN